MGLFFSTSLFASGPVAGTGPLFVMEPASGVAEALDHSAAADSFEAGGGSAQQALQLLEGGNVVAARTKKADPNHAVARYLEKRMLEAVETKMDRREFEAEIRGTFSRNVAVVLLEKVGGNLEYDYRFIRRLGMELQVKPRWAERIILRWQYYVHPSIPLLLSPDQWSLVPKEVRVLLFAQLEAPVAEGLFADPFSLAEGLDIAPAIVRETFHNVVLGTGRDQPREDLKTIAKRLQRTPGGDDTAVKEWELFWTDIAHRRSWKTKPLPGVGGARVRIFRNLRSAMDYAKEAKWSLRHFHEELEKALRRDAKRSYILAVFCAVVDVDVLEGKRGVPLTRPSVAAIKAEVVFCEDEDTVKRWARIWEDFAKTMNAGHAVRPESERAVVQRERTQKGDRRYEVFSTASAMEGNRARGVVRLFLERGMEEDAMLAANLLLGADEKPRVPASRFIQGMTGQRRMNRGENRLKALADQFGFEQKTSPERSVMTRGAGRLRRRLDELLGETWNEGGDIGDLAWRFREDEALKKQMGGRAAVLADLFDFWLHARGNHSVPWHLVQLYAFTPRGISKPSFNEWLRRFALWDKALEGE